MIRNSPLWLVVLLVSLVSLAPAAIAEAPAWMPIEIGVKKTFVHAQDREIKTAGESLGAERWIGTREEWVLEAPKHVANATAEVRVTTRVSSDVGDEVDTQRLFVSPTASAYQIHSAQLEAHGERYPVEYLRPAVALEESARPGEKWHVSTDTVAGLSGETWGEVVGIQDARTPAGLFEQCLVVRYTTELSGTLDVPGAGTMDVAQGSMVVTEWHAKGVGMVLAKEELRETLVGANGVEVVAVVKSQSSLKQLEGGGLAASAAQ